MRLSQDQPDCGFFLNHRSDCLNFNTTTLPNWRLIIMDFQHVKYGAMRPSSENKIVTLFLAITDDNVWLK